MPFYRQYQEGFRKPTIKCTTVSNATITRSTVTTAIIRQKIRITTFITLLIMQIISATTMESIIHWHWTI